MDVYQPGDTAYDQFVLLDSDNNQVPADSTPTLSVYVNNVLDTVATAAASIAYSGANGRYLISVPLPATYIPGDTVHVLAAGELDTLPFEIPVMKAVMQFRPMGALEARLHAFSADAIFVDPSATLSEELSENLGGYPEHAFITLEEALSVVSTNQTVILLPGDHVTADELVVPENVTLLGSDSYRTRILRQDAGDGGSSAVLVLNDSCQLRNLSIFDQTTGGVNGIADHSSGATSVMLDGVHIRSKRTAVRIASASSAGVWRLRKASIRSGTVGASLAGETHRLIAESCDFYTVAEDQSDTTSSTRRDIFGITADDGARVELYRSDIVSVQDDTDEGNVGVSVDGAAVVSVVSGLIDVVGGTPARDIATTTSSDRVFLGGGTVYRSTQVHLAGGDSTLVQEPMADTIEELSSEGITATVDFTPVTDELDTIAASISSNFDSLTEDHEDIIAVVGNVAGSVTDNAVLVNHDYGGAGNLTVEDPNGVGIENATIKIFLKSDYDAMNRSDSFLKGQTYSTTDGEWQHTVPLDPGDYAMVVFKQNIYNAVAKYFTVA